MAFKRKFVVLTILFIFREFVACFIRTFFSIYAAGACDLATIYSMNNDGVFNQLKT